MIGIGDALGFTGGDLLGAGLGYISQKKTNEMNRDVAREQMAFEKEESGLQRDWSANQADIQRGWSSAQAAKQMDFQRSMSNTAVSRRMEDMRKAGINPLLAGKYDASTPAGAIGTGGIPSGSKANAKGYTATSPLEGMFNHIGTALSLKKLSSEIKSIDATAAYTTRKTDLSDPFNRILKLLDSIIAGGTNDAQSWEKEAAEVRKVMFEFVEDLKRGHSKDQVFTPEKQPLKQETKRKYPLKGVKDKDRKPFEFAR